jgi:hypothetical protein
LPAQPGQTGPSNYSRGRSSDSCSRILVIAARTLLGRLDRITDSSEAIPGQKFHSEKSRWRL